MSTICGTLMERDTYLPHDPHGCRLAHAHGGPHEFVDHRGDVHRWQTDMNCDCDQCRKCDGAYCFDYLGVVGHEPPPPKESQACATAPAE